MLQTSYNRATKDSDVLETEYLTDGIRKNLLELAGHGSELHTRHRLYIDIVGRGIPFRRQNRLYPLLSNGNATLRCFEVEVMSVLDVVVSKLARFNANDQSDIDAMVEQAFVRHADLVECFQEAIDFRMALTSDEFARYVANLKVVEVDMLGAKQTEVEEPSWLT